MADERPDPSFVAFQKIVGRAATAQEVAQMYRIKDALQLSDNDPFWLVLFALEYYRSLYERIPERIEAAVRAAEERNGVEAKVTELMHAFERSRTAEAITPSHNVDRNAPELSALCEEIRVLNARVHGLSSKVSSQLVAARPLAGLDDWRNWPWRLLLLVSVLSGSVAAVLTAGLLG